MEEKKQKILVPDGVRTQLRDLFKTSYPTVRSALNGETNSELAQKIRHTAIERFGGVEIDIRVLKIKKLV